MLEFIDGTKISASGGSAIFVTICILYTLVDTFYWAMGRIRK